ncbi:MAG TPA: ParB/RepB/Spo0J family partition protein [Elusimicrobiales bacterium]|nr:ParB/RepB/Spo0J family partition protein [Elusimicrobiales bacterium]
MKQALGRGLGALIKQTKVKDTELKTVTKIPINKIKPNRHQPRKIFKDHSLEELAKSIKEHGLTQPIIVHGGKSGIYELIAGERRLRACKIAGLKNIDAIVRKSTDEKQMLAVSLVENIQREDLNPIDTAMAFRQLVNNFDISQNDLAKYCGKSKSTISNTLRLLELDDYIQKALQNGKLTEGHARSLLAVGNKQVRRRLYDETITKKLTVRDLENLTYNNGKKTKKNKETKKSADVVSFENKLAGALGTKVQIQTSQKHGFGKLIINYHSFEELDKIANKLLKR